MKPALAYLIFGLLTIVWGSNFILMKKASLAYGPVMISLIRVILGSMVLWAVFLVRERNWPFRRRDLPRLMVPALVGAAFPYSILPWLIERNGSGLIGMLIGLVPIMTILVSIPILGQWPGRRQFLGVAGGLAFLILLMRDSVRRDVSMGDMALAAVVPLCYATANTWIKKAFPDRSPLALSCAVLSLSAILLLPMVFLLPWPAIKDPGTAGWLIPTSALAANGVLATGAATLGFYLLIRDRGPLFAGLVAYLIPFGAIFWGWTDGEKVTPMQIISIAGILGMVALIEWENYRRLFRR